MAGPLVIGGHWCSSVSELVSFVGRSCERKDLLRVSVRERDDMKRDKREIERRGRERRMPMPIEDPGGRLH
jgi:hypothetical protein